MTSSVFESDDLSGLVSPSSVKVNKLGMCAEIVVEPLRVGFGVTLGNAIRRVLLSSLSGVAIVSVEVKGIVHEFSFIAGVKEDFPDIVLNLKNLVLKSSGATEGYVYLRADNGGPVTAGMLDAGTGFSVVNKDLVVCHLEKGHSIEMKMKVKYGTGYVQASCGAADRYDLSSVIPIDAIYNPVKGVNFRVESARAGNAEYDKLILNVETNGAITPEDAVSESAKIIRDQLKCLASIGTYGVADEVACTESTSINDILLCKIDVLDLSVRSGNCLKNLNITYVWELVAKTESDLLKTTNFGKKSLVEIKKELLNKGLSLGMHLDSLKKV